MIAKLIGSAVTPKMLGVVALLWLASLGGLYAYMEGRATSVAETAAAEARAACSAEKAEAATAARLAQAEAVKAARAQWDADQAHLDALAKADRERIDGELSAAVGRADTLFRNLMAHIHANPPDPSCRLDAGRVGLFNEARRAGRPAPEAGAARPGM